ncbi:hypothetical protein OROGR_013301 [Orobanche gracilis]
MAQLPPLVEPPVSADSRPTDHSIETLVVVLAAITIIGVFAGIIARICGGQHFGGSGEHDIEGWVERRCRSCIDGGVTASTPPPPEAALPKDEQPKPAKVDEANK